MEPAFDGCAHVLDETSGYLCDRQPRWHVWRVNCGFKEDRRCQQKFVIIGHFTSQIDEFNSDGKYRVVQK